MFDFETGYPCDFYCEPNKPPKSGLFQNMHDQDREWLESVRGKLSCEDMGSSIVLYLDVGLTLDDNETPRELIYVCDHASSPYEAISSLCEDAKKAILEK